MKKPTSEQPQNTLLFVKGEVFEELNSLDPSTVGNIGETVNESVKNIVTEILHRNVVAVNFIKVATEQKKKRSQADKIGKFRYLNRKIDKLREDVNELKHTTKMIMLSLAPFLDVNEDHLTKTVCEDEIDVAILEHLKARGNAGTTPNEAVSSDELRDYKLKPYHITRKIQRMNRRLKETLNRDFAVSVNRRWRLSQFADKIMEGQTEETEGTEDE